MNGKRVIEWQKDFDHQPQVLVIDDDLEIGEMLVEIIERTGVAARFESDPARALAALRSVPLDVVICDISMPEISGIEVLRKTRALGLEMPFVFLTGFGEPETIVAAVRLGAFDFLFKPCGPGELFATLERAVAFSSRQQRAEALLAELGAVAPQTHEILQDLRRQCALLRMISTKKTD